LVDEQKEDHMKLPSISLMAGGLMLIATSAMAADTMTTPQGLPPSTPEQSTGRPLGSLPDLSPTMPEGATQTMPNSAGTSSQEPTSPGAAVPPSAGDG